MAGYSAALRAEFENYRRERGALIMREKRRLLQEIEEANRKVAAFADEEIRLEDDPPIDDACPACFFAGRAPRQLRPAPSSPLIDRFKCDACSYEIELGG